jgi:drug/metabolite transporter (DMT)-like permease
VKVALHEDILLPVGNPGDRAMVPPWCDTPRMGREDHASATAGRPDGGTLAIFATVALLGGLNAIAVKVSVGELDPYWSAGSRFVAAGAILALFVVATGRGFPQGRSLWGAALYGAVGFGASFGLVYPALREVPAATAMVFIALVPLETFVLAILHRQEQFRVQGLVGALISLAGVVIVVSGQLALAVPLGAMALLLGGTLFVAESALILKAIPRADPWATNAVAMLTGGVLLLGISTAAGESWLSPTQADTWLATAYLVALGSIALFGLYLVGLRRWTASGMSYTTLLMPLITMPLAAVLLGEAIQLTLLVGGLVAIAGIYIGAFAHHRPNRSTATAVPECLPIDDCPEPVPARAGAG